MFERYSTQVEASPEYVLEVLRDHQRWTKDVDGWFGDEEELTFETTILDWRDALELLPPGKIWKWLNEFWGMSEPWREWRKVLKPERKRTLRDLANFIAGHARRTELRPVEIAGTRCLPAAAFLAVKEGLAAKKVDVSEVAPSTPLGEYARRHAGKLRSVVLRLAPGAMPPMRIVGGENGCRELAKLMGVLLVAIGWVIAAVVDPGLSVLPILITVVIILVEIEDRFGANAGSERSLPDEVRFGELRTFRDLAVCIAGHVESAGGNWSKGREAD